MFVTWILAIITVIMVPVLFYVGSMIGKQSRKFFTGQQQALGAVNGYIEETITGQKVIKVFCHEETAMEEFECLSDDLRKKQIKAQFFGGIMGPVMGNLGQISYALSATIGGILCLTRNFDIGGLTIFTNYSRQFSRPIRIVHADERSLRHGGDGKGVQIMGDAGNRHPPDALALLCRQI